MTTLAAKRTVLRNVSWETYECLLRDFQDQSGPRLTYDKGVLEIMSPLIPHDEMNRTLQTLVETVLDVWNWDYRNLGSSTFKREDIDRGFEPDTCFYIQHRQRIGRRETLDLKGGDPPPDLVIEIDLTHSSFPKEPIFAEFGVPERWRYENGTLEILVLTGRDYITAAQSVALSGLDAVTLNDLLEQSRVNRKSVWLRMVRGWARKNKPK